MFSRWPFVCLSVRPFVLHPSVRPSFPFDNLSIYKRISIFQICICISTNDVLLGVVNGQISTIYHRVMALVNVQKMLLFFLPLVPLLFGVS